MVPHCQLTSTALARLVAQRKNRADVWSSGPNCGVLKKGPVLSDADADDKCVFVDLRNCIARGTALATTPTSREMGLDRVVDRDASCELYMVEDQHA